MTINSVAMEIVEAGYSNPSLRLAQLFLEKSLRIRLTVCKVRFYIRC
jgi:hypothetical protein